MNELFKYMFVALSGIFGWFVAIFHPTFPLLAVAYGFILWDVQSAWSLDKRVHKMFPDKVKREKAYFESFKFGKVIATFIKSTTAVLLMFAARKYVCVGLFDIPLEYISAAVICGWQFWSVLENNASCPTDKRDSKFWKILRNILVDKTERHFDVDLGELKNDGNN